MENPTDRGRVTGRLGELAMQGHANSFSDKPLKFLLSSSEVALKFLLSSSEVPLNYRY